MSCNLTVYTQATIPVLIKEELQKRVTDFCKHFVQDEYGQDSIRDADIIIVSTSTKTYSNTRSKTEVCGFGLLNTKKQDKIELTLICSHRNQGKRIIQEAENQSRSLRKPLIELHALPNAIKFYEKQGYKHVNNACNSNARPYRVGDKINGYRMTKCLAGGANKSRSRRRSKSRSRKQTLSRIRSRKNRSRNRRP